MSEKELLKELAEWDKWADMANNCPNAEQRYAGIPAPKPTCKLTDEPCEFDICPKRKEL